MTRVGGSTPVIGIAGWKKSGKTTLAERLIAEFTRRGLKVASVKHAHHDFRIDDAETDSARHRRAGASQVAVVSAKRWALTAELEGAPEPEISLGFSLPFRTLGLTHGEANRTARLLKLCGDVQKFFPKCCWEFTFGSLPESILRTSERLQADLIAVPLSLDFVSHCWTTKDLLDELVRRANCAVLGVPSA